MKNKTTVIFLIQGEIKWEDDYDLALENTVKKLEETNMMKLGDGLRRKASHFLEMY